MPLYEVKCTVCEARYDVLTSYDKLQTLQCKECGEKVEQVPSKCRSVIHGFSEANGYSYDKINYDGSQADW